MFDLIQWRARKTPEAQALFFNGRWYSYRDLEGRANRLANRLLSLGVKAGDRVSVVAQNHLVHFDLLLAAPKIGVIYAPLNPQLGDAGVSAMVARIKPALVFVDSRYHELAASLGIPWARLGEYREWLAVGSLDVPPPPRLAVDDPYIFYGTANGVAVLPYRQVLLNARHMADAWRLSARDGTVHCLPCYGPEINLICLPLLYRGGRVVLMSTFNADEYLSYIALHRITISALTAPMLRQLVEYTDFEAADFSSLDWFACVGMPAPERIRRALQARGVRQRTLYARVEVGPHLFQAAPVDFEERPELLGAPLPEVELALHRPDGSPAAAGEIGTLMCAGPMVFSGYLDEPPVPPGLFDSGVAAVIDGDGQYLHRGCIADAFVSGGRTETLGTKAEIKNLNSFRFVEKAIEHEIRRQRDVLGDGGRGWHAALRRVLRIYP